MLTNEIINYTYNFENSAFFIEGKEIKQIKNSQLINNIKSTDGFIKYKKQGDIIFYVKYEIQQVTVDEKNNLLIFVHSDETNIPENSKDVDISKFLFED